mmetsp:Transcript_35517/g.54616  ORF Transcript_35517/g.54616 Transcript_35517/m.54616 type:complete len:80 (+) Transcript_35517:967-1206(+)
MNDCSRIYMFLSIGGKNSSREEMTTIQQKVNTSEANAATLYSCKPSVCLFFLDSTGNNNSNKKWVSKELYLFFFVHFVL